MLGSTLAFRAPRGARSCPRPRPPCGVRIRAHALSTSRHASSCAHPLILVRGRAHELTYGAQPPFAASPTLRHANPRPRAVHLAARSFRALSSHLAVPEDDLTNLRTDAQPAFASSPTSRRSRPRSRPAHPVTQIVRFVRARLATLTPSAHCLAVHTFLVHLAMPDSRKSRLAALPPSFTLRCSRSRSLRIQQRPRPGSPRDAPVRALVPAALSASELTLASSFTLRCSNPRSRSRPPSRSSSARSHTFRCSSSRSSSRRAAPVCSRTFRRSSSRSLPAGLRATSVFPDPLRPSAHVRAHCSGPHPRSRPLDPLRPSAHARTYCWCSVRVHELRDRSRCPRPLPLRALIFSVLSSRKFGSFVSE